MAYSGFTGAPTYGYTYDALGNIATYTQGGTAYTYTYDDLGQLLTATGGGKAYAYTYDLGGNILTVSDGTTSHTYTYGDSQWADLLTAFDGQSITYDASGNPLSYYNGTRYTFTWAEGRRLTSAAVNGKTYTYAYDNSGLRVSKTVNGVKHEYFYASGKLLRETYGNVTMDFLYNNNGYPYALNYTTGGTTTTYYYITNLQGDVLSLINASGSTVASYTYDPYGKVLTATGTMAETNPLRYRGYYYDTETGLYYLQSRYYDPTICRFINADAFASTGQGILGHNMFAYCLNNPVCLMDTGGEMPGIWQYLFADGDPGFIHRMVQLHILFSYNAKAVLYDKEFYMPGVGRADIIKLSTKEIWEIKYVGTDIQVRIDQAIGQVERYEKGFPGVKRGAAGEFTGAFIINCMKKSYLISYTTPSEGAIIYTVTPLREYAENPFATFVPSTVPVEEFFPSKELKLSSLVLPFCLFIPCGVGTEEAIGTCFGLKVEVFN